MKRKKFLVGLSFLDRPRNAGITDPPPAVTFKQRHLAQPHQTAVDGVAVEDKGITVDQPLG
jgi:hypothetical protein